MRLQRNKSKTENCGKTALSAFLNSALVFNYAVDDSLLYSHAKCGTRHNQLNYYCGCSVFFFSPLPTTINEDQTSVNCVCVLRIGCSREQGNCGKTYTYWNERKSAMQISPYKCNSHILNPIRRQTVGLRVTHFCICTNAIVAVDISLRSFRRSSQMRSCTVYFSFIAQINLSH